MLQCEQKHTFDLAREGYVNLLRKKPSGDTREMLQARRAFLAQGYYQPLSDALNQLLTPALLTTFPQQEPLYLLDAGCGEGYYLQRAHTYLTDQQIQSISLGIDISKDAIRMAARQDKAAFFLVANLKEQLPLKEHGLHAILNIFAPRNIPEYARTLAPQGYLLVAIPGPQHLQPLRTHLNLLQIEEDKQQHVIEQCSKHFQLLNTHILTYKLHLQQAEIEQIVMMTPNYWHLSDAERQQLKTISDMIITTEFQCLLFQRL
jgi:23S rRNA (guanine745-N1)-methyltransferase